MVIQSSEYWNVAIDGIQIFLCLLILIFLFKNRIKNKKSLRLVAKNNSGNRFNAQIFTQTVKQHADQAFANIFDAINAEQRRLERLLQSDQGHNELFGVSEFQFHAKPSASPDAPRVSEASVKNVERPAKILNLSSKGMSVREISEELKAPIDEVELVLCLGQNRKN